LGIARDALTKNNGHSAAPARKVARDITCTARGTLSENVARLSKQFAPLNATGGTNGLAIDRHRR
jgi:hypothetical protein